MYYSIVDTSFLYCQQKSPLASAKLKDGSKSSGRSENLAISFCLESEFYEKKYLKELSSLYSKKTAATNEAMNQVKLLN